MEMGCCRGTRQATTHHRSPSHHLFQDLKWQPRIEIHLCAFPTSQALGTWCMDNPFLTTPHSLPISVLRITIPTSPPSSDHNDHHIMPMVTRPQMPHISAYPVEMHDVTVRLRRLQAYMIQHRPNPLNNKTTSKPRIHSIQTTVHSHTNSLAHYPHT